MNQSRIPLHNRFARLMLVAACLSTAACVYRMDIQQGNVLQEDQLEQVSVGMTRSQVEFLLGTPMVADPFHRQRWDYPFYLRRGRSENIQRGWVVVHFEGDRVSRIERDVQLEPIS